MHDDEHSPYRISTWFSHFPIKKHLKKVRFPTKSSLKKQRFPFPVAANCTGLKKLTRKQVPFFTLGAVAKPPHTYPTRRFLGFLALLLRDIAF